MKIWLSYVNYPITTAVYLRRALLQMGHQVKTIGPRMPEELIEGWQLQGLKGQFATQDLVTSFNPDLAVIWQATPASERPDLYLWVESINGYWPENLHVLQCPKVGYLIDSHVCLKRHLAQAPYFDHLFIAQRMYLDDIRAVHSSAYWLPLGCDPLMHSARPVLPGYDISFVGNVVEGTRRHVLLVKLAQSVGIHNERCFLDEMATVFSASRIVFNNAINHDLNMRFFEVLSTGSLLLSDLAEGSGQSELFTSGEDYVCYRDDDIIEQVLYYLQNESLRKKIAARGQELVRRAHTYTHRMEDLLNVVLFGKADTWSAAELRRRSLAADDAISPQSEILIVSEPIMLHTAHSEQAITVHLSRFLQLISRAQDQFTDELFFAACNAMRELIDFYHSFWDIDQNEWYRYLVHFQTEPAKALMIAAHAQLCLGQLIAACWLAEQAGFLSPSSRLIAFQHAELLRRAGQPEQARAAAIDAISRFSDGLEFQSVLDICDADEKLPLAMDHYQLLRLVHKQFKPRRYIEIGISTGKSLALAVAGTSVIGVDPETGSDESLLFRGPETVPVLMQLTSDDFFAQDCITATWGSDSFDIAFIDGLHLFEQVLRDFINLEKHTHADSLIFIHDCLPISNVGAERERTSRFWTGDVWKVIPCLKEARPDLEIITFPVRHSGLALIRRLDRNSPTLQAQFDDLVNRFMDAKLSDSLEERFKLLNITHEPPEQFLSRIKEQQGPFQL